MELFLTATRDATDIFNATNSNAVSNSIQEGIKYPGKESVSLVHRLQAGDKCEEGDATWCSRDSVDDAGNRVCAAKSGTPPKIEVELPQEQTQFEIPTERKKERLACRYELGLHR